MAACQTSGLEATLKEVSSTVVSDGIRNLDEVGIRLKDKIKSKKLININNKINKQLYVNVIVI